MDLIRIGGYIQHLRKAAGLTQKQLAERLGVTFQAVSKWETGETLPDASLLLPLCEQLNTTADKLLNGGSVVLAGRRLLRVEDVVIAFENMEDVGKYLGEDSDFFTGMVEGINRKMDIDLLSYLSRRETREVLWAEALIQGLLSGRTVDMDEVEAAFTNKKMVEQIRRYRDKTAG